MLFCVRQQCVLTCRYTQTVESSDKKGKDGSEEGGSQENLLGCESYSN
jgi:hypothetical protein